MRSLAGLGQVAPLVFLPARLEVARRQQVLAERQMAVGVLGLQAQRSEQAGDGMLAVIHVGEHQR